MGGEGVTDQRSIHCVPSINTVDEVFNIVFSFRYMREFCDRLWGSQTTMIKMITFIIEVNKSDGILSGDFFTDY